jgi:hypothetical protein
MCSEEDPAHRARRRSHPHSGQWRDPGRVPGGGGLRQSIG